MDVDGTAFRERNNLRTRGVLRSAHSLATLRTPRDHVRGEAPRAAAVGRGGRTCPAMLLVRVQWNIVSHASLLSDGDGDGGLMSDGNGDVSLLSDGNGGGESAILPLLRLKKMAPPFHCAHAADPLSARTAQRRQCCYRARSAGEGALSARYTHGGAQWRRTHA